MKYLLFISILLASLHLRGPSAVAAWDDVRVSNCLRTNRQQREARLAEQLPIIARRDALNADLGAKRARLEEFTREELPFQASADLASREIEELEAPPPSRAEKLFTGAPSSEIIPALLPAPLTWSDLPPVGYLAQLKKELADWRNELQLRASARLNLVSELKLLTGSLESTNLALETVSAIMREHDRMIDRGCFREP